MTTQCSVRDHRGTELEGMLPAWRSLEFSMGEKICLVPLKTGRKRSDRCQERGTKCDVKVVLFLSLWVEALGTQKEGHHCTLLRFWAT